VKVVVETVLGWI